MAKPKRRVHLICNAHLDPVWLWEWEEGAAAAISTFRTAADFCEQYDGFIFNHNEALLYEWVEEYEPELFARIQKLVAAGKWSIMGGWFLQPDCNMPSGESFVRQILYGRRYFSEKFNSTPTTAMNFDPFGHTRGLVQIMARSGFDSYLFCRPQAEFCPIPADDFTWVGYDGSEITATRSRTWYCTHLGAARSRLEETLPKYEDLPVLAYLWGVGNHGGGPSRIDLKSLMDMAEEIKDSVTLVQSSPEVYFDDLRKSGAALPRHENDLNPWGVGCYTSQIRIKQKHRQLENELFSAEKMAAAAWLNGAMDYPEEELRAAQRDLLLSQFHDILPGSSIQPVEFAALRLLDHGSEILSRVKARAFFALAGGQAKARENEIPILVYNPHPFDVTGIWECEFQLADQNWTGSWTDAKVYQGKKAIPSQVEKEASNIPLDWRKKVAFHATLKAGQMNRFDCKLIPVATRPEPSLKEKAGKVIFDNGSMRLVISAKTGLVDSYSVGGTELLRKGALEPLVMADSEDPWEMTALSFRKPAGAFKLMTPEQSAQLAGVKAATLQPVRVIEDGDARTVVEACFAYGHSSLILTYDLPKQGAEFAVGVRVIWAEKNSMLKLSIPGKDTAARLVGQVAYGKQELKTDGDEKVAQKWAALVGEEHAVTVINDGTYGLDCLKGELRLSLLRSPVYSGHPINERPITRQDRFTPRIDQGERLYRFWICGGAAKERMDLIDREALVKNEAPMELSFFPSGHHGQTPQAAAVLSDSYVQLTALKRSEDGKSLILRLFEPTGKARTTTLKIPALKSETKVKLGAFEIKTLRLDPKNGKFEETDLVEGMMKAGRKAKGGTRKK